MKISQRLHHRIRIRNLLITFSTLCLLASLAWLSSRYTLQSDWTANSRNTLSETTIKLLETLTEPIEITAYLDEKLPVRKKITQIVNRYSRHKPDTELSFVTPASQPDKIRELDIGPEGAIIVSYEGREEKLTVLNEYALTNVLLRLANAKERWVTFLSGHGERSPTGNANHGLGQFGKELARLNIKVLTLNLATLSAIPDNTSVLVIAGPQVPLLNGEIDIVQEYVQQGGNLLWLTDPDNNQLSVLAEQLGIHQHPGTIIDSSSQLYGIDDPTFVIVSKYFPHAVTRNFQTTTIFPISAALEIDEETDYNAAALLTSVVRSWTETGPIEGEVRFDADGEEREGPLDIAVTLTREFDTNREQRIIVVGDGDFLSNAFIGNVGNLDLGLRMINWLSHDDRFIDIPPKTAIGQSLLFSKPVISVMGFGFLIVLPLMLIGTGLLIWRKRKRS